MSDPSQDPGILYAGCSGWAYSQWKPDFYPAKLPAKKFLEYYAGRLNSVEVNYTFRQLPSRVVVEGWLSQVGNTFRFSFKAPQRITHIHRLKDCGDTLAALYAALVPALAAGKAGPILFQLAPNFKVDHARLEKFLEDAAPAGVRRLQLAFEFRHPSWFCDATYDILHQHNSALCIAESDDLETPEVNTASFSCYRLRKSQYKEDDLQRIDKRLVGSTGRGDVFAYFKHEDTPEGALQAEMLLKKRQSDLK